MPARLARSVGLAAPKSFHKAAGGVRRRRRIRLRLFHLVGECGIEREPALGRKVEKALRQVDIAGGERRADFAFRNGATKYIVERLVGDLHRIIGSKLLRPLEGIPSYGNRCAAQHERAKKRKGRLPQLPANLT